MANTEKTVHCINWMHDALLDARENGNRGAIKSEKAVALGVTESQFELYKNSISVLYEALCDYVRAGKSKGFMSNPMAHEAALKEKRNRVFDLWRQILDWGEAEKDKRRVIVHPRDIEDLMTVVQRFQNDAVNVDDDKNFVARKVWATVPEGVFRAKVETILGIRMVEAEVMSDEEREHLRKLNRCVSKIRKHKANIEAEEKNIQTWEANANRSENEEFKAECKRICDVSRSKIESFNKKIAEQKAELDKLTGKAVPEAAPAPAPAETPAAAPVKKTGKKSGKKAA